MRTGRPMGRLEEKARVPKFDTRHSTIVTATQNSERMGEKNKIPTTADFDVEISVID